MKVLLKSIFILLLPVFGLVQELTVVFSPSWAVFQFSLNESQFFQTSEKNVQQMNISMGNRRCDSTSVTVSVSFGLWFFRTCFICDVEHRFSFKLHVISADGVFKCFHNTYSEINEVNKKTPGELQDHGFVFKDIYRNAKIRVSESNIEAILGLVTVVIGTISSILNAKYAFKRKWIGVIACATLTASGSLFLIAVARVGSSLNKLRKYIQSLGIGSVSGNVPWCLVVGSIGATVTIFAAIVNLIMLLNPTKKLVVTEDTTSTDTISESLTNELREPNAETESQAAISENAETVMIIEQNVDRDILSPPEQTDLLVLNQY